MSEAKQEMPLDQQRALARVQSVVLRFQCDSETAWRYLDLRDEGYSQYQASVMSGLADPSEAA